MTTSTITQQLIKLHTMDQDALTAFETVVRAAFDKASDDDDVDRMEEYVEALEAITVRASEITAETEKAEKAEADAKAEAEKAAAEAKDEKPTEPEAKTDEKSDDSEEAETNEVKADAKKDQPEADETTKTVASSDEAETNDTEEAPAAMAASAGTDSTDFQPPEDHRPVVASASTTVVAGTDIPGISAGTRFGDPEAISRAMIDRIRTVGRSTGGDGEQYAVARVLADIPDDRMLAMGDPEGNAGKIQAVMGEQAITAAGGFCAPLEVRYDIFGIGSAARPVKNALATFGANRGGIRYVTPPSLGSYSGAVSIWSAATDATPGEATKPLLTVECAPEETALTYAVTLQLKFGNLMARAYPELVSRNNQLALIAHARLAERTLLSTIAAGSTTVSSSKVMGTARDFLLAIGRAGARLRNVHRVPRTTNLRVIAPEWVLDAMREDFALQIPGDNAVALADSVITSYLNARNISVTWHMDGVFATEVTNTTLDDFPALFEWYIFPEGTWLFLDGGTLDLGVVRDSGLVSTNDYITFVETFEGAAKIGPESVRVVTTTDVHGITMGTAVSGSVNP